MLPLLYFPILTRLGAPYEARVFVIDCNALGWFICSSIYLFAVLYFGALDTGFWRVIQLSH